MRNYYLPRTLFLTSILTVQISTLTVLQSNKLLSYCSVFCGAFRPTISSTMKRSRLNLLVNSIVLITPKSKNAAAVQTHIERFLRRISNYVEKCFNDIDARRRGVSDPLRPTLQTAVTPADEHLVRNGQWNRGTNVDIYYCCR